MSKCFSLWNSVSSSETHRADIMEGKPVVDNFVGWTMTNKQFTNNHPSVLQDHVTYPFRVCISNVSGSATASFLKLNACASILEPLDHFAENPLRHDTVPILHWHPSAQIDTLYAVSIKNGSVPTSVLWCKWQAKRRCLWHTIHDGYELSRSHLHHDSSREVESRHAQKAVKPTARYIPIDGIIFDSFSYNCFQNWYVQSALLFVT
jgi:hypothetical protein